MGFFVPFFFAYTGIKVDLTMLRRSALAFTVAAVMSRASGRSSAEGSARASEASRSGRRSPWASV